MITLAETRPDLAIVVEPLTAAAFAPFGEVVAHAGSERRQLFPDVFAHLPEAGEASFWVSRVDAVSALPLTVTMLERHPFTAQTFLPLSGGRYLAIVTGSDAQGRPDLGTARAFLAQPNQGITYRRDVWHHGMTILDGPAQFAVLMHKTGRNDDDVFLDLERPFLVRPLAANSDGAER